MKKCLSISVKIILAVIVSSFLISCRQFEEIVIGEPQEIQIQGIEDNALKVSVTIPVENPTIYKIQIQEIDLRVFLNDQYIGKLLVDDTITIKPKSDEIYQLQVKIRLANILNTAFIMLNMQKGKQAQFTLDGNVKAKTLFIKKNVIIKETRVIKM